MFGWHPDCLLFHVVDIFLFLFSFVLSFSLSLFSSLSPSLSLCVDVASLIRRSAAGDDAGGTANNSVLDSRALQPPLPSSPAGLRGPVAPATSMADKQQLAVAALIALSVPAFAPAAAEPTLTGSVAMATSSFFEVGDAVDVQWDDSDGGSDAWRATVTRVGSGLGPNSHKRGLTVVYASDGSADFIANKDIPAWVTHARTARSSVFLAWA